jgi:hypothetical protein
MNVWEAVEDVKYFLHNLTHMHQSELKSESVILVHKTMQILFNVCCFVFSAVQAAGAIFAIWDSRQWKHAMAANPSEVGRRNTGIHLAIAAVLIMGAVGAGILGGYLSGHPIKPYVVEKTVTVEKLVPCPPAKTGSASTKGQQSPATSGNQNSVTYGEPGRPKN